MEDYDDEYYDITEDAVTLAFPDASSEVKKIIARWYDNEGAYEDFDNAEDFADFMQDDINDMIAAGDGPNVKLVYRNLKKLGYI